MLQSQQSLVAIQTIAQQQMLQCFLSAAVASITCPFAKLEQVALQVAIVQLNCVVCTLYSPRASRYYIQSLLLFLVKTSKVAIRSLSFPSLYLRIGFRLGIVQLVVKELLVLSYVAISKLVLSCQQCLELRLCQSNCWSQQNNVQALYLSSLQSCCLSCYQCYNRVVYCKSLYTYCVLDVVLFQAQFDRQQGCFQLRRLVWSSPKDPKYLPSCLTLDSLQSPNSSSTFLLYRASVVCYRCNAGNIQQLEGLRSKAAF